jgi:acyl-coenzyme A synthetase/AMP-(fatty) acid ligase
VREVLRAHPQVADAAVRLMRPDEGRRLKAFVVPRPDASPPAALRGALERWLDQRLETAARPRSLTFGSELPRNPLGKAADWDLQPAPAED